MLVCTVSNGLCGGLGDRMRAIRSFFWLAVVTHRPFFLHFTKPTALREALLPNSINWEPPVTAVAQIEEQSMNMLAYKRETLELCKQALRGINSTKPMILTSNRLLLQTCLMPASKHGGGLDKAIAERVAVAASAHWSSQLGFDFLFKPSRGMLTTIQRLFPHVQAAWSRCVPRNHILSTFVRLLRALY